MTAALPSGHTVVELRRYTLHPGRRDELIDLFERELLEPQEAAGMTIIGQFRDLDHPDTFTWLRSFPDMPARRRALDAFYGGRVWTAHRDAANATMIDSDDVHLLRGVERRSSLGAPPVTVQPASPARRFAVVVVRPSPVSTALDVQRRLHVPDWAPVLSLTTLRAENDVPRLPVHDHDVAVAVVAATDADAVVDVAGVRSRLGALAAEVSAWRLHPTERSRLR